jgi:hypothetical protein
MVAAGGEKGREGQQAETLHALFLMQSH